MSPKNDNALGLLLRELRVKKGLTQKEAAKETGFSQTMICLYEQKYYHQYQNRPGLPSFIAMIKLADAYEVHHSVIIDKAVEIIRRDGLLNKKN